MPPQEQCCAEILEWCVATHVSIQNHRHQLAARYPVIALALARLQENSTMMAINAAIDRGVAVDAAIAGLTGVSPFAVTCLENISAKGVGSEWINHPIELLWAMDVLHPLDGPQTLDEWDVLRKLWINTGLEEREAYRKAAGVSRDRQVALEYLFRGLCAQGYGQTVRTLADRLSALLPGIETDPENIWPFHCYVSFVEMSIASTNLQRRAGSWHGTECLLMRYSPSELIRQWESWRCLVAAHGRAQLEVASECEDMSKTQWIMRHVVPDYDEAVRWLKLQPL